MILPEYNVMSNDLNALLATLKTEIPSLEENIQNIPIAIISVHGWTPKALIKVWKIDKKSDEMAQNMTKEVCKKLGIEEEQGNITKIPLKGFGTVLDRVDKFSKEIEEKEEWLNGIKKAKLLFVIGHSQGCPTSVILLERLFKSGIVTPSTQRICLTLMAGVFEGPTPRFEIMEVMRPLIEELGDKATLELFDFQKSTSDISLALHDAYTTMIKSRVKMVQLGVGNDEVVPLHSSLFTSVKHPSIYRAFYVNGEICQQKSFLSDFVALLIKILNHGHSDSGLLGYVSEALIGALSDEGHSSIIREDVAYRRAIDVFFDSISHQLTDSPIFYDFNYTSPQMKPCFISWAMRGLLMNDKVITADNIAPDITDLCKRFLEWKPVTPQSRLIKDALEPIGVTRERKGIPVLRDSEPLKT